MTPKRLARALLMLAPFYFLLLGFPWLLAGGRGVARSSMRGGSEQKAEADLAHGAARLQQRKINADAEGFKHVG